jgi:hypothetical protein
MRALSRTLVAVLAWALLVLGLAVIALNPGVPSIGYALLWLGVMALARALCLGVPAVAVAIDLSLLLVCFVGLEIGGLILVPALIAFAVADALGSDAAARLPSNQMGQPRAR